MSYSYMTFTPIDFQLKCAIILIISLDVIQTNYQFQSVSIL
jgi:hypothetical protein